MSKRVGKLVGGCVNEWASERVSIHLSILADTWSW